EVGVRGATLFATSSTSSRVDGSTLTARRSWSWLDTLSICCSEGTGERGRLIVWFSPVHSLSILFKVRVHTKEESGESSGSVGHTLTNLVVMTLEEGRGALPVTGLSSPVSLMES